MVGSTRATSHCDANTDFAGHVVRRQEVPNYLGFWGGFRPRPESALSDGAGRWSSWHGTDRRPKTAPRPAEAGRGVRSTADRRAVWGSLPLGLAFGRSLDRRELPVGNDPEAFEHLGVALPLGMHPPKPQNPISMITNKLD